MRETDFAGMLVTRFASYHRQNYGGCKGGVSDIVIGAATICRHERLCQGQPYQVET